MTDERTWVTARMTNRVTIVEVGPRDGLQNEAARVATADKVAFVERLAAAGLPVVEVVARSCGRIGCRSWPTRARSSRP